MVGISMRVELRLLQVQEAKMDGKRFSVDLEDEDGKTTSIPVHVVPRAQTSGLGYYTGERIDLREGIRPILIPILLQMIYYRGKGYTNDETETAALLYGRRVLNAEDYAELVALLGAKTSQDAKTRELALANPVSSDGSKSYYLECFSSYADGFSKNKWIARARAYANTEGLAEIAEDYGKGAIIARDILAEGPIYGTDAEGRKVQRAPAMRELLPEIVGGLESLAHALRESGHGTYVIRDRALIRALYFFAAAEEGRVTREGKRRVKWMVHFVDDKSTSSSAVVELSSIAVRRICSVLSHLRVSLEKELHATEQVLTCAKKVYGQLGDGTSFRGMLEAGKAMTPADDKTALAIRTIAGLEETKKGLENTIMGVRARPPSFLRSKP